MNGQQAHRELVHVVDDDDALRAALLRLLRANGIAALSHATGAEFLQAGEFADAGCILLDVKMPGLSGLDVQAQLAARGIRLPTIFLTGAAEVPIAVAAMRAGAIDFIEKPFENADLVARVRHAIDRSRQALHAELDRRQAIAQATTLTPREREVLTLLSKGLTNKEVAKIAGTSHRTIEIHRRNLMEKVQAESLADLVRLELMLQESMPHSRPDT